jgi:hypothetical protein
MYLKQRLLSGWNFSRIIYLIMGVLMVIQSIMMREYLMTAMGLYFSAMGLLGFGCASGNCFGNQCEKK